MKSFGSKPVIKPKRNICVVCNKTVYSEEQAPGVDLDLHETCFRCQYDGCNVKLFVHTYASVDKKIYCKNHFKVLTAGSAYVKGKTPRQNTSSSQDQPQEKTGDLVQELEKLADLKAKGILSQEEFEKAKAKLLGI